MPRNCQSHITRLRHELHQEPEIGLAPPAHPGESSQSPRRPAVRNHPRREHDVGHRGSARRRTARFGRQARGPAARGHGRPPRPGTHRRRLHLPDRRRHARLRPRSPHLDAGRGRHPAGRTPRAAGRRRRPDVPARRGRLRRRGPHDPRRRPGRRGPPRGRRLRHARVLLAGAARPVRHQARRDAQCLGRAVRHHPGRRRPRLRPALGQGPRHRGRRDGDRPAGHDHAAVQHVRSRSPDRRRPAGRHHAQRHPRNGPHRGDRPDVLPRLPRTDDDRRSHPPEGHRPRPRPGGGRANTAPNTR